MQETNILTERASLIVPGVDQTEVRITAQIKRHDLSHPDKLCQREPKPERVSWALSIWNEKVRKGQKLAHCREFQAQRKVQTGFQKVLANTLRETRKIERSQRDGTGGNSKTQVGMLLLQIENIKVVEGKRRQNRIVQQTEERKQGPARRSHWSEEFAFKNETQNMHFT